MKSARKPKPVGKGVNAKHRKDYNALHARARALSRNREQARVEPAPQNTNRRSIIIVADDTVIDDILGI